MHSSEEEGQGAQKGQEAAERTQGGPRTGPERQGPKEGAEMVRSFRQKFGEDDISMTPVLRDYLNELCKTDFWVEL